MRPSRDGVVARVGQFSGLLLLGLAGSVGHGQVSFVEVTADAGITFVNHGQGVNHAGVAAVDLTGDGYPELFFQDGYNGANHLYRNNRDGTFTEVGEAWGVRTAEFTIAPVFFDFDNDGRLDLALASKVNENEQRVRLLRNYGGVFVDISDACGLIQRWGISGGVSLKGLTSLDYNGDGFADLFVTYTSACSDLGSAGIVYRNLGNSTFALESPCVLLETGCSQWQAMASDLNLDGLLDVFGAEDFGTESHVFLNDGLGSLIDVGVPAGITGEAPDMGIGLADYDQDGDFDVYVTDITERGVGGNRLFRNELIPSGSLRFTNVAEQAGVKDTAVGWGATFFDYDNDGWLDLAVASSNRVSKLFRSRGNGTFEDVGASIGFAPVGGARGIAAVDFDLDGDLDVILGNVDGPAQVYRNDGGNARSWIRVALADRTGREPQATGAKITLFAPGIEQMRETRSAENFNSQEPFTLHFGMGTALVATNIRVEWPDGTVTNSPQARAGQTHRLVRSRADMNRDARLTFEDGQVYRAAWQAGDPEADLNGDGLVNDTDAQLFLTIFRRDR